MATLGQPERVVYISKNLVSGLTDIKARVSKPNGDILGPFTLQEFSDVNFKGFYYFDFPSSPSDDYGTYVGVITSPSEKNHRAPFKITYETISIDGVEEVLSEITEVIKLINNVDVELDIEDIEEIEVELVGEG